MTRASLASEVRFTREYFWKVREYERSHARVYRECERSHTRVFRECERYNSRVHREYEARRTRAESKGLGEESAGPVRRTRAESTGLGEDSAGPARRKSTEARRREHGSLSSECRGVKQKARRLGGPEQNSEISEGERWLVYTHARRARTRDVSTYRGARWAVAHELPALASNTRASDRALASNTRARGGALASTRWKCASDRARTRECKPSHSRVTHSRVLTYL